MKRITMVLAGMSIAAAAAAQQATQVFTTVDSVTVSGSRIIIRGVPQGGSAPVAQFGDFPLDTTGNVAREECHRMLLLALGKPGQYRAQLGPGLNTCTVALAAP